LFCTHDTQLGINTCWHPKGSCLGIALLELSALQQQHARDEKDLLHHLIFLQIVKSFFACFQESTTAIVGDQLISLPSKDVETTFANDTFTKNDIRFLAAISNVSMRFNLIWAAMSCRRPGRQAKTSSFMHQKPSP